MLSKKVLKDIQSLGLKKHREEQGLFIAEGPKIVSELVPLLKQRIVGIYGTESWIETNASSLAGHIVEVVSEIELERLSQLQTPNAVLMVAKQAVSEEPKGIKGITLYLDAIQDPGNFGTIIRIADWFGIQHVVCGAGCAELYNPKVVQSTMASIARVNVWYDKEGDWLGKQKAPKLAAALNGISLFEFKTTKPAILLIGNESKGLRPELLESAEHKITIPRIGEAESLNAAVATGIILSHLIR